MDFLYFLAQFRTPAADTIVQWITYLAEETIVMGIICWLFWCASKQLAYCLGFSYFTSGLLVQGLKITFRIPRPWVLDPQFQPVASAISGATSYSFPSGHTQSVTALMGTLGLFFKNKAAKIICFILIAAVMFSRMYLGVHTPQDVCVSFLVSFACVILAYSFFYINKKIDNNEKIISIIMVLACIAISIYAIVLNKKEILPTDFAEDCIKAAGAGVAFAIGYFVERRYIRFSHPETFARKILRMIVGLAVTLLIQQGLKPILGTSLLASFVRYFLVVAWVIIIYPFLFTKKHTFL